MAEISSLRQIGRISPDLANAFREASEMESRASFISERGTVQFSISACTARLHGKEVSIVTFNDITREMETTSPNRGPDSSASSRMKS